MTGDGPAGSGLAMQATTGRRRDANPAAVFHRFLIFPFSGMLLSAAEIIIPVSPVSIKPGKGLAGLLQFMLIVRPRTVILYHCSLHSGHCL
jgi:hypothetical protein